MKDPDGILVHTAARTTTVVVPSASGPIARMADAARRPAHDLVRVGGSAAASYGAWEAMTALPHGFLEFGTFVGAAVAAVMTFSYGWSAIEHRVAYAGSGLHRLMGRLSPRRSVARAAASNAVAEWNRISFSATHDRDGVGREPRMLNLSLPGSANISILNRRDERPLVVLSAERRDHHHSFDPKASLGPVGAATVIGAVRHVQLSRLRHLLGLPQDASAETLSRVLAEALPCKSRDDDRDDGFQNPITLNRREIPYLVETRELKSLELVVVSLRRKHRDLHEEVFVSGPGIGSITLPPSPFSAVMAHRRASSLKTAFGAGGPVTVAVPMFLGNARATRLAELARQALADDPSLTDANGSPIRSLIEEHMPRLLAAHRDGTRTASSSGIAEIDAVLDRGLDVVARALGEAIDGLNDRKLDALRTEVRFLETRHPDHSTSPLALAAA